MGRSAAETTPRRENDHYFRVTANRARPQRHGPGSPAVRECRLRALVGQQVRDEIEPSLRAMRRRLGRDRDRVHGFHDELHRASVKRLAALANTKGESTEADRRRETMRIQAVEREQRPARLRRQVASDGARWPGALFRLRQGLLPPCHPTACPRCGHGRVAPQGGSSLHAKLPETEDRRAVAHSR